MAFQGNTVLWRLLEREEAKKRAEDAEMQQLSDKLYQAQQHEDALDQQARDREAKMASEQAKLEVMSGREQTQYDAPSTMRGANMGDMEGGLMLKQALAARQAQRARLEQEATQFTTREDRFRDIAKGRDATARYGHELDYAAAIKRLRGDGSGADPKAQLFKALSTQLDDVMKNLDITSTLLNTGNQGGIRGLAEAKAVQDEVSKGLSSIRSNLLAGTVSHEDAARLQAELYNRLLPYGPVIEQAKAQAGVPAGAPAGAPSPASAGPAPVGPGGPTEVVPNPVDAAGGIPEDVFKRAVQNVQNAHKGLTGAP